MTTIDIKYTASDRFQEIGKEINWIITEYIYIDDTIQYQTIKNNIIKNPDKQSILYDFTALLYTVIKRK